MYANKFYGRTGTLKGHEVEVEYDCPATDPAIEHGYTLVSVKLDEREAIDELSAKDEEAICEELDSYFRELTEDVEAA